MTKAKLDPDAEMTVWFIDEKIEFAGGFELKTIQHRGMREETFSEFYNNEGKYDFERANDRKNKRIIFSLTILSVYIAMQFHI